MDNFNFNRSTNINSFNTQVEAKTRSLMTQTFIWMALAMVVSIVGSLLFAYIPSLKELLYTYNEFEGTSKPTILYWVLLFAPFAFILLRDKIGSYWGPSFYLWMCALFGTVSVYFAPSYLKKD